MLHLGVWGGSGTSYSSSKSKYIRVFTLPFAETSQDVEQDEAAKMSEQGEGNSFFHFLPA
jgi:hypothetical protein